MNVFSKIKEARELLGQTQSAFAVSVGANQKDVSKIEQGSKKFIPNKYIEYLIKENFDINTLFNSNLKLSRKPQLQINEPIGIYKSKKDVFINIQTIPLYSLDSVAGISPKLSDLSSQDPIDYIHIPNAPKCDGALYYTGDSMYPLLKSGDILAYKIIRDIPADIHWGQKYIVYVNIEGDNCVFRKFIKKGKDKEHILLVSANPHYEDKEVHLSKITSLAHIKLSVRIH
jgi:phage repressor protein C with HTH and peptisase S24 domain